MPGRINPPLPTRTRDRARAQRQSGTDAEQALWYRLRAGRLDGFKFRRQHPVPPYMADFYCETCRLVVELDGSQHDDQADRERTRFLEARGLKVLRFWDDEVLEQIDSVLEVILRTAHDRTLTPTPLPQGEGLKSEER